MKSIRHFFVMGVLVLTGCQKDDLKVLVDILDDDFLSALIEMGIDTDGDSLISRVEAEAVTKLVLPEGNHIEYLNGIEAFINLDTLHCSHSPRLISLDVSGNTRLKYLNINNYRYGSSLFYLNVSNNTALEHLDCRYNYLGTLDVSTCPNLQYLNCWRNQLSTLDVTHNTALLDLDCGANHLSELDISLNKALTRLYCSANNLTSLNVSNNVALEELYCGGFLLTLLDLSKNTALTKLDCSYNQLSSLDLSQNTDLTYLGIGGITTLFKICVWIMPFPPEGVSVFLDGSDNAFFTTDCID